MNLKQSKLYAESWNVAYRFKPTGSILTDKETPFCIIPNSYKFWAADPFVFDYKNDIYVFAELYDYKLRRGVIGYSKLNGNKFGEWIPVICESYHMSYPFIFEHNGDIYMIPETSGANALILYKAVDFPVEWEKEQIIKDNVKWVDTTLFKRANGFVAFTESIGKIEDLKLQLNDSLDIISSEIIDCETNKFRCGGRMFEYDDKLVRVCQDCSEKYGGALYFRFCDKNSLSELTSQHITPEELSFDTSVYLDGIHTYNSLTNIEVIDIKTRRLNLINFIYRFAGKIKKI